MVKVTVCPCTYYIFLYLYYICIYYIFIRIVLKLIHAKFVFYKCTFIQSLTQMCKAQMSIWVWVVIIGADMSQSLDFMKNPVVERYYCHGSIWKQSCAPNRFPEIRAAPIFKFPWLSYSELTQQWEIPLYWFISTHRNCNSFNSW